MFQDSYALRFTQNEKNCNPFNLKNCNPFNLKVILQVFKYFLFTLYGLFEHI